jgi:hypothetical protein
MYQIIKPKLVRALYRSILQRNPKSREEIIEFAKDFFLHHNLESRIRAMIYSEEFQIMVLPELVGLATFSYTGEKIFFLHVPKTAGTSARIAIVKSIGMPSYNLYNRNSFNLNLDLSKMDFWPFWSGHANVHAFPVTHTGFTIFRESMSRILSLYRQQQFEKVGGIKSTNPHILDSQHRIQKIKNETSYKPFDLWLEESKKILSINHWYVPNLGVRIEQKKVNSDFSSEKKSESFFSNLVGHDYKWRENIFNLSERELIKPLQLGLAKFKYASWIHDAKEIGNTISKMTGGPSPVLETINEFRESKIFRIEKISNKSIEILKEIKNRDDTVLKIGSELGLISILTTEDEERYFKKSIDKLGFEMI